MENRKVSNLGNRFAEVAGRIGGEIHLQALRDTFAILMPFFVLAGLGTLLNSVLFPYIFSGTTLEQMQVWGSLVNNSTLNICGLKKHQTLAEWRILEPSKPVPFVVVDMQQLFFPITHLNLLTTG